jgi:hypothetical protein
MSSTLIAHNPKFQSQLMTLDQLAALPAPPSLGSRHKPVPHHRLVTAIHTEVERRGMEIQREQFAVGRKGAVLFGVFDLTPQTTGEWAMEIPKDRSVSMGLRNGVDQSFGITGVAGSHVLVCDNLALSGTTFAIKSKNTTGLDLAYAVAAGFDKFMEQSRTFNAEVTRLQTRELTDMCAKAVLFDCFYTGIAPLHLFDDVSRYYFEANSEMPDCQPRTLWGLTGAFTRAFRTLSPQRLLGATTALGKAFATIS